jgi:multiple sugar transport system permease protein
MTSAPLSLPLRQRRQRKFASIFVTIGLVVGLCFVLLPVFWLVETALQKPANAFAIPPHFFFVPTGENFTNVIHSQFAGTLVHSAILMVMSTVVALVLGVPAAYAMTRSRFRGSRAMSVWLIGAYITPALVYIVPLYVIYQRLGLIGSYVGLMLYYETFQLPFTIFMMRAYFSDVPREFDESAWVDGCSKLRTFRSVILPLVLPGVATVTILDAIASWGEYFGALIFSSSNTETAPVAIYQYVGLEVSDWSEMAAAALFIVVPIMILTAIAQRGLMRGLMSGGLVG